MDESTCQTEPKKHNNNNSFDKITALAMAMAEKKCENQVKHHCYAKWHYLPIRLYAYAST